MWVAPVFHLLLVCWAVRAAIALTKLSNLQDLLNHKELATSQRDNRERVMGLEERHVSAVHTVADRIDDCNELFGCSDCIDQGFIFLT
jgi:hypothetical protein